MQIQNNIKVGFLARFRRSLLGCGLASAALLVGGCSSIPKETFHCVDNNGQPVEGVLLICRYSGSTSMSYYTAGADYRFSDSQGAATFGADEVSRQLSSGASNRNIEYVYSPHLRSGGMLGGEGRYKNKNEPLFTSYWTLRDGEIRLCDNAKRPELWFAALYHLTEMSTDIIKKKGGYYPYNKMVGMEQLAAKLGPFLDHEWAEFFKQYGNTPIPMGYFVRWFHTLVEPRSGRGVPVLFNDLKRVVAEVR